MDKKHANIDNISQILDQRREKKKADLEKLFPFLKRYWEAGLEGYVLNQIQDIEFQRVKLLRRYSILGRLDNNIYTLTFGDLEALMLNIDYCEDDQRPYFSLENLDYISDLYDSTLSGPLSLGKTEFRNLYEMIAHHRLPDVLNQQLMNHILGEFIEFLEEICKREVNKNEWNCENTFREWIKNFY